MPGTLATSLLRVAQEQPSKYERSAFKVSAISGGTPRIWTKDELLLEDAGPGLHMHYSHRGRVLEVRVGNQDYRDMAEWLESLANKHKVKLKETRATLQDRSLFAPVLCKILSEANDADIVCDTRGDTVHFGSLRTVLDATEALLSRQATLKVMEYFGIPNRAQTVRM